MEVRILVQIVATAALGKRRSAPVNVAKSLTVSSVSANAAPVTTRHMPPTQTGFDAILNTLFPASAGIPELGPGPRSGVLATDSLKQHLAALGTANPSAVKLIRALSLVWNDHHDEAHDIVQDLPSADAAYVHAILHRREPDYFNAKYWFRRVGMHSVFPQLAANAAAIIKASPRAHGSINLRLDAGWDAFAFVDACQNAGLASSLRHELIRQIQQAEFVALMAHFIKATS